LRVGTASGDSPFAYCAAFEPILAIELPETVKRTPIFGPDNELMKGVAYLDTVFQKRG